MKLRAPLIVGFALLLQLAHAQRSVTTFILVRHAEKADDGTKNPGLTPAGRDRAARLATLLSKEDIAAIYTTDFKRTRETVQPLAEAKGLVLKTYEPFNVQAIEEMARVHRGKTVVVCGHSNTIPWTANLLIGSERFNDFADDEYENILIVDVVEKGKVAKVVRLVF